jgi:hypothetical protein
MRELAEWLSATSLSTSIQSVPWIIPAVQTIHILTVGVVFVSMLMIVLRVLGVARTDQPLRDVVRRFAPFMWWGLLVMTITGLTLVVGEPVREFFATSFWVKMALLAVAVASAALFLRTLSPAQLAAADAPGAAGVAPLAKWAAGGTVVLWLAIIFLGRAIAYDIEVWSAWSLASRI